MTGTGSRHLFRSFRSRLLLLAAMTGAVAAMLVSAALVSTLHFRMHRLVAEQLAFKSDVIALSVAPAVFSNEPEAATETLVAVGFQPHIAAAYVVDPAGRRFAAFEIDPRRDDLPRIGPHETGLERRDGWLLRYEPLVHEGQRVGRLVLVYDPTWLTARLWGSIGISALIALLAMGVAMLIALRLQRDLAGPVRELVSTSRAVSETGDFSITARKHNDDELGELTDAFNAMLARIDRQASQLQQTNDRLRDREQRLTTLTNAVPAIVWSADADGAITSFNEQWYDHTGRTEAQSLATVWREAIHPDDRRKIDTVWSHAVETGEEYETEVRIRRHDGVYRWFMARAVPLRDEAGNITGWFGTTTDIEDRKRAETERDLLLESERAARTEAERAGRMKDEFVATLSHELRTPLTAILGWAQMLKRQESGNGVVEEGLDTIERNARVQTQIIEDLLDMSRIVSGKLRLDVRTVHLPDVIDAAIGTIQPAAEAKDIQLQKIIDPRIGPVKGDAGRLQQIVWNLLSNAVKFTPRGGRVHLALERVNSHIEISVSDTGEGMEPEFLPHLFERFRQADASTTRQHAGLGLGLAIVKHLAELHGGSVRAVSPGKDKGSTFTVMLPVAILHQHPDEDERQHPAAGAAGGGAPATPVQGALDLQGIRVLLVEDEADARTFIERLLERAGAEVLGVASASAALEQIEPFRPDVIVSDIGMPAIDGYQFIREVRQRPGEAGGRTPAVALTAFARSEDRTRALMAGYQIHVAKPVEPAELLASIASASTLGPRR